MQVRSPSKGTGTGPGYAGVTARVTPISLTTVVKSHCMFAEWMGDSVVSDTDFADGRWGGESWAGPGVALGLPGQSVSG